MTDDERALSAALTDLAGHARPGLPPLGSLLDRGRRRRHTRSAFTGALGVTGVCALAALTTLGPRAGASPATDSGAARATAPGPIGLSLAAARTDDSPFHFSLTAKSTDSGGKTRTAETHGAFDPAADRGWMNSIGGGQRSETIRIGDTCYAQPTVGGSWLAASCATSADNPLAALTEDPAADLKQLETNGLASYTGRTGSGSGALDTWKFSLTQKPRVSTGSVFAGYTLAGTASVGVDSGQIASIDYTLTVVPDQRYPVSGSSIVSIAFSDYGVPVSVTAPAATTTGTGAQ